MTGLDIFLLTAICVEVIVFVVAMSAISELMKSAIVKLIECIEEEVMPKATVIGRLFLYFTIGFLYAFRLIFVVGYWLKYLAMKPWKLICKICRFVFVKQAT